MNENLSPVSPLVLAAAALVTSPALWGALVEGSLPLHVALTRLLVAVIGCWLALWVVRELAFPSSTELARARNPASPDTDPDTPAGAGSHTAEDPTRTLPTTRTDAPR